MPAPTPTIDLTDAEKRDLIALIQAGKPLPEKYRFVLFEDKRELELVWNGKTRDVCTTVLPFRTLEHVDEPRPSDLDSPQAELFGPRGRQVLHPDQALSRGMDSELAQVGGDPLAAQTFKRPRQQNLGLALQGSLVATSQGELVDWEEGWTGGCIFETDWQSFRTRQDRELELKTAPHVYARPGRCTVAVKVIDIFGNDTMTLLPVSVG